MTLARSMSPVEMNGELEVAAQPIGLCSLAGPGRAHQDQVELGHEGGNLIGEPPPGADRLERLQEPRGSPIANLGLIE